MICDFARDLDDDDLETIQGLEQDLGVLIVAFRCRSLDPAREERVRRAMELMGPLLVTEVADPDEAQLDRIRGAEERLGLSLVAMKG